MRRSVHDVPPSLPLPSYQYQVSLCHYYKKGLLHVHWISFESFPSSRKDGCQLTVSSPFQSGDPATDEP